MAGPSANSVEMVRARVLASVQMAVTRDFHQMSFTAMSTNCRLNFICGELLRARQLQQGVLNWIARFEAQYSRFIPDSLVGRINAAAGSDWVEVDAEGETLFNLCEDMVSFSGGVFDPTTLPLIQLWNWKAQTPTIPSAHEVAATLEMVGWSKVQRRKGGILLPQPGMCLDLGAIGKEYAVDCIATQALQSGVENVIVDFGQDLRVHGKPPERPAWRIGLEDSKHPGQCWTALALNNHAVASSGDYVRHFTADGRRYGHIIDPRNGYPANSGCLSVSVVAPQCALAGILATTAFVLGPEEGRALMRSLPSVEGAIITEEECFKTPNFNSLTEK